MVAVFHGSSFFKPIGQDAVAGDTGATGPAGSTGPTGHGVTGASGSSGGNLTEVRLIGDKLHQIFTFYDGSTSGYTTLTKIQGATGDTYTVVDGGNTYGRNERPIGGAEIFIEQPFVDSIKIRSIESTGDILQHTQNQTQDEINIHFDRGRFGYANLDLGSPGVCGGELVGAISGQPQGLSGTYYSSPNEAIEFRSRSFKEKTKYLVVGSGGDFQNSSIDGPPSYEGSIDSKLAKTFILDMTQVTPQYSPWWDIENVSSATVGGTGPIILDIKDAEFGYTGHSPPAGSNLSRAFTLYVHGATNAATSPARFQNVIWPFDRQPCFSGQSDIFNFFWFPCEPRSSQGDGIIDICPDGHAWHGNVVQWRSSDTDTSAEGNNPFGCDDVLLLGGKNSKNGRRFYTSGQQNYTGIEKSIFGTTGATGACCMGAGMCVHTTDELCYGYYLGAGTTCNGMTSGGTGSVCLDTGSCCLYYSDSGLVECLDDISANECVNIGEVINVESTFGGIGTTCISSINCFDAANKVGACCDGIGGCENLTRKECTQNNNFFLGIGIPCVSENIPVCSGGTGACCKNDSCVGITGEDCISTGYLYAGNGTNCSDINCRENTHGLCTSSVLSLDLKPGDLYAGGMVVGMYRPNGSYLFGATGFGGNIETSWENLMLGGEGSTSEYGGNRCQIYRSKYDYNGYGITSDKGCSEYNQLSISDEDMNRSDSYYMITSLSHIGIKGDREVVSVDSVPGSTSEFYWGNKGSSWGPLYNRHTNEYDDLNESYKDKVFGVSEGWWMDQHLGELSRNNIPFNTFPSCRKARRNGLGAVDKLLTKSAHSSNGLWHRNWGLHNTIRIVSADNALYSNYNDSQGAYTSDMFGPGLTADYISSFRAVRLLDDELQTDGSTGGNIPEVSDWFIPSHDELSFIAANCIDTSPYNFNLNSKLIAEGGTPFDGWYWSSTGAFDETKGFTGGGTGEGIVNSSSGLGIDGLTADPGSLAWAMKFNTNGNENLFRVAKKNRIYNKHKVRPIRLIRCDGMYSTGGSENEKLWKIPKVLRDSDRGINQD
jgi:hypothetical protein|tara:strand:- start:219 stop:3374 length:3156 start_codon:yes stop_codon:yes gene_type:complete